MLKNGDGELLVSIIVPTFNDVKRLNQLLISIKKQTYKNYEILVGDYNSTDGTVKLAKKYGCKIFEVKKPGIALAKNKALKHANGDIIAFIDADCVLSEPNLIENVVNCFENNKKIVIIQANPIPNRAEIEKDFRKDIFIILNWFERAALGLFAARGVPFFAVCVFCRGDTIRKIGYFNEHLSLDEDHKFFTKFRKYGAPKILGEFEESYRRPIENGILKTIGQYIVGYINVWILSKNKYEIERNNIR